VAVWYDVYEADGTWVKGTNSRKQARLAADAGPSRYVTSCEDYDYGYRTGKRVYTSRGTTVEDEDKENQSSECEPL